MKRKQPKYSKEQQELSKYVFNEEFEEDDEDS